MGFFSFNSEFEISVKHPKEEAYSRFYDYVNKQSSLKVTASEKAKKLFFSKGTSLFSYPIDFKIYFEEIDNSEISYLVDELDNMLLDENDDFAIE